MTQPDARIAQLVPVPDEQVLARLQEIAPILAAMPGPGARLALECAEDAITLLRFICD